MAANHQDPTSLQPPADPFSQLSLKLGVEVGERQVATEHEVEGAVRQDMSYVLLLKADALSNARLQLEVIANRLKRSG